MQLGSSNSVDLSTLLGLTRFYANTLNNVDDFSDAQITALLNQKYRVLQTLVLNNSFNNWEDNTLDGTGNGLINLSAGANNYAIPSEMISIDRVELNYEGDDNTWVVAYPANLNENEFAISNAEEQKNGTSTEPIYWVRSGQVYIDPVPNQAITGGMKVWCTIEVADLSSSTDEPKIHQAYQPILCMDAAIDHCEQKGKDKIAQKVKQKSNEMKAQLIESLQLRNRNRTQKAKMQGNKKLYV